MLECVVNISEGRDGARIAAIAGVAGPALLDLHSDPHHHRSVLTLVGEDAPRAVATACVEQLDLRGHQGVHPRLGVLDVVPFVALDPTPAGEAVAARDRFLAWLAHKHGVPCFAYGPERTLPEVRRGAFTRLRPDAGPPRPHPSAGATAVGARPVLVAYNVWLDGGDLDLARRIAAGVRGPGIRALGLQVGPRLQISMNLVRPQEVGPADAFDAVADAASASGARAVGAELVGLLPRAVLETTPASRWTELDLGPDRTIEARRDDRPGGG